MISGLRSEVIQLLIDTDDCHLVSLKFDKNFDKLDSFEINPRTYVNEYVNSPPNPNQPRSDLSYQHAIRKVTLDSVMDILREIIEEGT